MSFIALHQKDDPTIIATLDYSKKSIVLSVYYYANRYNITLDTNEIQRLKDYLNALPIKTHPVD